MWPIQSAYIEPDYPPWILGGEQAVVIRCEFLHPRWWMTCVLKFLRPWLWILRFWGVTPCRLVDVSTFRRNQLPSWWRQQVFLRRRYISTWPDTYVTYRQTEVCLQVVLCHILFYPSSVVAMVSRTRTLNTVTVYSLSNLVFIRFVWFSDCKQLFFSPKQR